MPATFTGSIQHLRSTRAGARPGDGTVRSLLDGEVFINQKDGVLCYLADSGVVITAYFLTADGMTAFVKGLPASDPGVSGAPWLNNNVLTFSA